MSCACCGGKEWESYHICQGSDNIAICPNQPIPGLAMEQLKDSGKSNAHRIVQCVNSHDELVEACKNLIRCFPTGTSFKTVENAQQAITKASRDE